MAQRVFKSMVDFGFSQADAAALSQRLKFSHIVFIAGPPGGGKLACASLIGWFNFQGLRRPFRTDGREMSPEQVREAAKQGTHGILFHDIATQADLAKVAYCADCRMVSIASSVIAEPKVKDIAQILHFFNATVSARKDLILIGVEPDPASPEERYKVECRFPAESAEIITSSPKKR